MKLALVGAGSAEFSLKLVRDLCLTPGLAGSTVHLLDVDEQRLGSVRSLLERYAREVGADLDIDSGTDRGEALDGADFVINTALTAPNSRLFEGWRLAQALGYRHGGSLHVMHDEAFWINFFQLRFFCELAEDMLATCSGAWLIQAANPVFAGVTHLTRTYPGLKITGICHGFREVYALADVLDLDRDGLTFEIPGVNHFVWLTRCDHDGRDVFPLLDAWLDSRAAAYWESCQPNDPLGPKQVDLYRRFGALPIGDTGSWGGGSWGWSYHTDARTEARWQVDPARGWEEKFEGDRKRLELISGLGGQVDMPLREVVPPTVSGEVIVPLVESIACDVPRVLIGNVANAGESVTGLPLDVAVEVPLAASGAGLQPLATAPLPDAVMAYALRDYVAPVEVELAAFTEGSRSLLLELVLEDPWTTSAQQGRELIEGVLSLPGHEELLEHYR